MVNPCRVKLTFYLSSVSGFRMCFSDSKNILRLFKEEVFVHGKSAP